MNFLHYSNSKQVRVKKNNERRGEICGRRKDEVFQKADEDKEPQDHEPYKTPRNVTNAVKEFEEEEN